MTMFFAKRMMLDAFCCKAVSETLDAKATSAHPKRLRILTVCATAHEVYSIALSLCEWIPDFETFDIQIVATDTDDGRLRRASLGCFNGFEVDGLNINHTRKYFLRDSGHWRIHDRVRMLLFFQNWDMRSELGNRRFDICFCPIVPGDFQREFHERITGYLTEDGYLFSDDETLPELGDRFRCYMHCGARLYLPNKTSSNVV